MAHKFREDRFPQMLNESEQVLRKFVEDVAAMAMLACSDPHKRAGEYRNALADICNKALVVADRYPVVASPRGGPAKE